MQEPSEHRDPIEFPVVCPMCQERLKRMNSSHLRAKHDGMTMGEFVEKFGDHSLKTLRTDPSEYIPRMVDEIAGYMARDEELSPEGKLSAQELVQNQDAKLRLVLNLMATAGISELGRLHQSQLTIRNVMLDHRRLADAKDGDLLKMAKYVEDSLERTLNYVKSLSIERKTGINALFEKNVINVFQGDASAPKLPGSAREREQVGELFRALLDAANRRRLTDGGVVEAEYALVGQESDDGGNGHPTPPGAETDAGGAEGS